MLGHVIKFEVINFDTFYDIFDWLSQLQDLDLSFIFKKCNKSFKRWLSLSNHWTNLTALHLLNNGLIHSDVIAITKIDALKDLHYLDLSDNEIGDVGVRAIASSRSMKNLGTLLLKDNKIGHQGIVALTLSEYIKNLRVLDLRLNNVCLKSVKCIASSSNMKNIRILKLGSPDSSLFDLLTQQMTNLTSLDVQRVMNAKMEKINIKDRTEVDSSFQNLTHLNINCITKYSVKCLLSFDYLKNLKSLKINNGFDQFDDNGVQIIVQNMHNLEVLKLRRCNIGNAGARAISFSRNMSHLKSLNLSMNEIEDDGVIALCSSQFIGYLDSLKLGDNRFDRNGIKAIATSTLTKHLKVLELQQNYRWWGLGSYCLYKVADSENMKSLMKLSINNAYDYPLECLAKSKFVTNLTCLKIYGDFDNGIKIIASSANMKHLKILHISCGITEEDVRLIETSENLRNLRILGFLRDGHRRCVIDALQKIKHLKYINMI